MDVVAAVSAENPEPMEDNVNGLLQAIFGIFENLADIGATWGDPWGWLFPTLVALGIVLGFAAGVRYVFQQSEEKIKPWFFFALFLVGVLAFAAISRAGNQDAATDDPPTFEDDG